MAQVFTVSPGVLDRALEGHVDEVGADHDGHPVRVGAHHVMVGILEKKVFKKKLVYSSLSFCCS